MSPKLPRRTAAEVRRAIEKTGFVLSRQSGSHQILHNPAGRRITLPVHAGRTIHPKILKRILADAGLTVEEFEKLVWPGEFAGGVRGWVNRPTDLD